MLNLVREFLYSMQQIEKFGLQPIQCRLSLPLYQYRLNSTGTSLMTLFRQHLGLGLVLLVAGAFVLLALSNGLLSGSSASEPSLCTMTYMYPRYTQISMRTSSRLARKYELYEYNDDSLPRSTDYSGIPILFIPGNAGSFRQVRSIGTTLARAHRDGKLKAQRIMTKEELISEHKQIKLNHFDVFAANFHEEFSAFDGDLLNAQKEFVTDCVNKILSLYKDDTSSKTQPKSVILLGHSMGGVVARSVFSSPTYRKGTVRTILTLNTPHVIAPIILQDSVSKFYENTHLLWQNRSSPIESEIEQSVVLSVGAGWRDIQVHASLSNLESVSFGRNLISTVATSVPNVWVSMDHDSCMWCNQLMTSLSSSLTALIDPNTKQIIESPDERTKILRRYFQSSVPQALHLSKNRKLDSMTKNIDQNISQEKRKAIQQKFESAPEEKFKTDFSAIGSATLESYKFKWDLTSLKDVFYVQILTTMPLDDVTAVLCKKDFSFCIDLKAYSAPMPYQIREISHREFRTLPAHVINAPLSHEGEPLEILAIATNRNHPIAYNGAFGQEFFISAQLTEQLHEIVNLESPLGQTFKPSQLISHLVLKHPVPYLAYRVTVSKANIHLTSNFKPLLMQYATGMMKEERYGLEQLTLKFHDVMEFEDGNELVSEGGEFHQWQLNGQPMKRSESHLFVFSDPNIVHSVQISIDWIATYELILRTDGPLVLGAIFVVVLLMISHQLSKAPKSLHSNYTKPLPGVLLSLSQIISKKSIIVGYALAVAPTAIGLLKLIGADFSLLHDLLPSLSYNLMPLPWPDTNELAVVFSMAILIIFCWSFITSLFFRVLNASYLAKSSQSTSSEARNDAHDREGENRNNSLSASSNPHPHRIPLFNMPISAWITGILLTIACVWGHPVIGLVGGLFYLILPPPSQSLSSASPSQKLSLFHLRHGFFVLYSTLLLLIGPNGLIWAKGLHWSHTPFSAFWPNVTAIIWHIVLLRNLPPNIVLQHNLLDVSWMTFVLGGLMAFLYLFRVPQAAYYLFLIAISSIINFISQMIFGPFGIPRANR